jgi:hypothetical protein
MLKKILLIVVCAVIVVENEAMLTSAEKNKIITSRKSRSAPVNKAVCDPDFSLRPASSPAVLSKEDLYEKYKQPYDYDEKPGGLNLLKRDISHCLLGIGDSRDTREKESLVHGLENICDFLTYSAFVWPEYLLKNVAEYLRGQPATNDANVGALIHKMMMLCE